MNERIKELADKATVVQKTFHGIEHITFDKEKFAELIVRECLYVVKLAHSEGNEDIYSYDDALDHVEYNMKQHFGVEE